MDPPRPVPTFEHSQESSSEPEWSAALTWAALPRLVISAGSHGVGPGSIRCPDGRIVVAAAHPDDETLGAAGVLAQAEAAGREIVVVVVTNGERSHPLSPTHRPVDLASRRAGEVLRAVHLLAPSARVELWGMPDTAVAEHVPWLTNRLSSLLDRDSALFAPYRFDGHGDHEALGRAAAAACRRTGAHLWEYPIWLWHWGHPADLPRAALHVVELDQVAHRAKLAALDCHSSQHQPLSDRPGDEALLSSGMLDHHRRPVEIFVRMPEEVPTSQGRPDTQVFDEMFTRGDDPWGFLTSAYESRKRALTMSMLPTTPLRHALDVGCSTGLLTAELAARCEHVAAVDVSGEALRRAQERLRGKGNVTLQRLHVPNDWPSGQFDLIVVSEVAYFLTESEYDALLARVQESLAPGGHLLLCHWRAVIDGYPLDAAAVHAAARALDDLSSWAHYTDPDVVIDVLRRHSPNA